MNENNAPSQKLRDAIAQYNATRSLEGILWGKEESHARVTVRVERRGVKILDTDNLYGSAKFIVDACKAAGFITGDDPSTIDLIVTQTRVKSRQEIETIVEITYGKD